MKLTTTSSIVLAGLALSGSSSLAAPTPPLPFDSPVPASPKPDDWDVTQSPRLHKTTRRHPLPAIKAAGARRSLPSFKRQEATPPAPAGAPSGGLLHTVADLLDTLAGTVHGLPLIGSIGLLSEDEGTDNPEASQKVTDELPSPSHLSARGFFEPPAPPQAPQLSAEQLTTLRNAFSAILQQEQHAAMAAETVAAASNGLPVNPAQLADKLKMLVAAENQAASALSDAIHSLGSTASNVPAVGPSAAGALQNSPLAAFLGGNGQIGSASALSSPLDVASLLQAIQAITGQTPAGGAIQGATGLLGGLLGGGGPAGLLGSLQGLLPLNAQVSPPAAPFAPQAPSGLPFNNLPSNPAGFPSTDGFYPHGFPVAPPNSPASPPVPIFGSFALAPDGIPPLPVDGVTPPVTPPAAPAPPEAPNPGGDASATPPVPPNSPVTDAASVPMGHAPVMSIPLGTPAIPAPELPEGAPVPNPGGIAPDAANSLPKPDVPVVPGVKRRAEDEDANFQPSTPGTHPARDEMPPLLVPPAHHKKRTLFDEYDEAVLRRELAEKSRRAEGNAEDMKDCHGMSLRDAHEGGPDAVPGPQDAIKPKSM